MQEIFDSVKNVFTNMQAIGWEPWPLVMACAATIIVRLALEDDVINITTIEGKRKQNRAKMAAFLFGYFISVIACYGFDKIDGQQDTIQAFMFSLLNAGIGYLAWSFYVIVDPINRIKDKYGKKETQNAPTVNP